MSKQKKRPQVVYYTNELEDDFAGTKERKQITVDGNYVYIHNNLVWKFFSFVLYRMIAKPFVALFCWIKYSTKIKNKKVLKSYKKKGYFIYGNHTLMAGDAFHPNLINPCKRTYILVNPDAVSIKGIKTIVEMLGGMPVATTLSGARALYGALKEQVVERKHAVAIYPEAHIWPYCTTIRNFKSDSFRYPVVFDVPTFCFTTVYKKRKCSKKPKIEVWVDGPFFAPNDLSVKDRETYLRDRVYETMKERSGLSDCVLIEYVKKVD